MNQLDFPHEVAAAFESARAAVRLEDHEGAWRHNLTALDLAQRAGCVGGVVQANRMLGVTAYRLGRNDESARHLEVAVRLAAEHELLTLELLCSNHLGATYRKLGRLSDAHDTLKRALERADAGQLEARTRLLGSYGAFWDDVGDREAAAEHYARYEELACLLDDPARLANARGLVSRSYRLRGRLEVALEKAREERRLGVVCGVPLREGRGWMHMGQALAALNDDGAAAEAFARAGECFGRSGDVRAPVDIAVATARYHLEGKRLQEAFAWAAVARERVDALPRAGQEHEHRAKVYHLASSVSQRAGLHGEALWYLAKALESEIERFRPIAGPEHRALVAHRRRHLRELAAELIGEQVRVERAEDEVERVSMLLCELDEGSLPPREPAPERIDAWRARVREAAVERWTELLPGVFGTLNERTQGDLVLADLVAQGPVGDLERGVLLLFTTIERELRERVIVPLKARSQPPGSAARTKSALWSALHARKVLNLGDMVTGLVEARGDRATQDALSMFHRRFSGSALRGPVGAQEGGEDGGRCGLEGPDRSQERHRPREPRAPPPSRSRRDPSDPDPGPGCAAGRGHGLWRPLSAVPLAAGAPRVATFAPPQCHPRSRHGQAWICSLNNFDRRVGVDISGPI